MSDVVGIFDHLKNAGYMGRMREGSQEYLEINGAPVLLLKANVASKEVRCFLPFSTPEHVTSARVLRLMGWRGNDLADLRGIGDDYVSFHVNDDGTMTIDVESTIRSQAAMPKEAWLAYVTAPIDDWSGFVPCSLVNVPPHAMRAMRSAGWDGDVREGPFQFFLPDPRSGKTQPAFAWKQNNNGSCFVASTLPLSYLGGGPAGGSAEAPPPSPPRETDQDRLLRTGRSQCESPIEVQFFDAMMSHLEPPREGRSFVGKVSFGTFKRGDRLWDLYLQFPYNGCRIDFVLGPSSAIAIELDGHEFHERTKEQAQRDKSRDRMLTANRFRVVRFTGSEVFRNAEKCVKEVLEMCR